MALAFYDFGNEAASGAAISSQGFSRGMDRLQKNLGI